MARVLGVLFLALAIGRIQQNGFGDLDDLGWISHEAETAITVQQNWFTGEFKFCTSVPNEAAIGDKKVGYALDYVQCDNGSSHLLKVKFWGREHQPEYSLVYWKCIRRNENGFECFETGGLPKPQ